MKIHILISLFVCFTLIGQITFEKTFGSTEDDYGKSVYQTSDGGYIITGVTMEDYKHEVYLIKTDPNGVETWSKKFGGDNYSSGESVLQTSDGGYIIAGSMETDLRSYDAMLIKTDSNGNETWKKTYGGVDGDGGDCVVQTLEGGYILTGNTYSYGAGMSDLLLVKTDPDGNQTWLKTFGESFQEFGRSVIQTSDSCFFTVGSTFPSDGGSANTYLIKTDPDGNKIWEKKYSGTEDQLGRSIQYTKDNGFIIAGSSGYDINLLKINYDGNEIWSKTYGDSNSTERAYSVNQTSDGGYFVAGDSYPYGGNGDSDVYVLKTDSAGNKLWDKTFGGTEGDYGNCVQQTQDGGYIITGMTSSYGAGSTDVYLIKTDEFGSVGIEENDHLENISLYQNYPNPFNPTTEIRFALQEKGNVKLTVFNSKGELVKVLFEGSKNNGTHSIQFDASALNSGIYFYTLNIEDRTETRKMLLLK